jgi:hypothetical protein
MSICNARTFDGHFEAETAPLSLIYDETQAWLREGMEERYWHSRRELYDTASSMFQELLRDAGVIP